MKRYINSARNNSGRELENLRKQQAEWRARYDARKAEYLAQLNQYDEAGTAWETGIKSEIEQQFQGVIDKLPRLRIDIGTNRYFGTPISITFDNAGGYEACSLCWEYYIKLTDTGEVKFESASWSGLSAVNSMQILDLKNTADFLQAVVEFDGWSELLTRAKETKPDWDSYVTITNPENDSEYRDPGYDKMIQDADLSRYAKKDYWIKGKVRMYGRWETCWIQILSTAEKSYNIKYVDNYYVRNNYGYNNVIHRMHTDRKYKDKVRFDNPLEVLTTAEFEELCNRNTDI